MYCTNCGAQVNPSEKFCMKCGSPIDPLAINAPAESMPAVNMPAANVQGGNAQSGYAPVSTAPAAYRPPAGIPAYNTAVPQQKKKKIWPIVVGIIAALLVVSIGAGLAVRAVINSFVVRTHDRIDDEIEEEIEEFAEGFSGGDFDFDYDFDYDFDFDIDEYEDVFPDDFDVDEFMEEYSFFFDNPQENFDYQPAESGEYEFHQYEYAEASYYKYCVYLAGRDVIDDSTVLVGNKTMGEFCDYIDSEVLEKGRKIDRNLLYDLLEVHMVDGSLIDDNPSYFRESLMYCLTFANEFGSLKMNVESCLYYLEEPTVYYYTVRVGDDDDIWVVNYSERYIYMDDGNTEYNSTGEYSMFSDNTLSLWMSAIEEFFGV